jgi:hypothetical protein
LINCVKLYREIRKVVLAYENSSSGREKLVYRHGIFCISGILLKRLAGRINHSKVLDDNEIKQMISHPLDELRQQTMDIVDSFGMSVGPLALFRNQGHALPIINELMITHYGHTENSIVANLRNIPGL